MAWEKRKNGKRYFYRSVRRFGRIEKEYYGSGYDALAAEKMIEAMKQARKRLSLQKKHMKKQAALAARRLQSLLKIPFPALIELLVPTKKQWPKLTNRQEQLVGRVSAEELRNWGKTALFLQILLVSHSSPSAFKKLKQQLEEQLSIPEGICIHPIIRLYSEQMHLVAIQEIFRRKKTSGGISLPDSTSQQPYPRSSVRNFKAFTAFHEAAKAVQGAPVTPEFQRGAYRFDVNIDLELKFPDKEIETDNLCWAHYVYERVNPSSASAQPSIDTEVNELQLAAHQAVDTVDQQPPINEVLQDDEIESPDTFLISQAEADFWHLKVQILQLLPKAG